MYQMGDYTNCRTNICEIIADGEYLCNVVTEDFEIVVELLGETEQFKNVELTKGDYTNCRYDICEIVDEFDDVVCTVATDEVEMIIEMLQN